MRFGPVRKLSFEANGRRYDMEIDLDVEREKAEAIAGILDDEGVDTEMDNLPMRRITIAATGTIRAVAMRRMIQVLAL